MCIEQVLVGSKFVDHLAVSPLGYLMGETDQDRS